MQTRGFGAARKPANVAPIDRYCISPPLAPSTLSAKDKAVFADPGLPCRAAEG